jgi:drug/metabolite transporter (DMT)-like permease
VTATPASGLETNQKLKGIALMVSGTLLFLLLDTFAKKVGESLPFLELVWGRYFFNFVVIALIFGPHKIPKLLKTNHLKLNLIRGFLLLCATLSFFGSLMFIPLGTATSIGFVWPLVVTALSVPFLGEKVGLPRWSAVVVGFIGALIIIQPGGGIDHWAVFLPLSMACFYSSYQIITRKIDRTENPFTGVLYSALIGSVLLAFALPFVWVTPDWQSLLAVAFMGVIATAGHTLVIKALQTAPASLLAPFAYIQVVASIIVSWLYFGDQPEGHMIVGAALIVGAGIFVIYRERKKAHVEPLEV